MEGEERMYHCRCKGSYYEMGVKRGKIFNRSGIIFPLKTDKFQYAHGEKSEKILRDFFPEVCEEIRGVTDTVGADYMQFVSWMLCMGCCMYNLEENLPVEVRGCTAFAYAVKDNEKPGICSPDKSIRQSPEGEVSKQEGFRVIYGRNNDLPPCLKKGCKSELYAPKGGSRFHITTSSFINGEEGINEHGLAAAMTFVMTDLKKIKPGFNSCFIVRYLLEKAENVEQAVSLLSRLPVASNCNILLADKSGNMAAAECTPSVKRIREAEAFAGGRIVCTVNAFTSDEMKGYDDAGGNDYDSGRRYKTVMDGFAKYVKDARDHVEETKRLLRGDYGFICQYDEEPDFETVWSSVFDLNSLEIYCAEGDPRKKKFIKQASP